MTCVPSKDTEKALRAFGVTCPLAIVGRGVDPDFFTKPSKRIFKAILAGCTRYMRDALCRASVS